MTAPALELREVRRRFGAVIALDGASVRVRPGTVHAVLGENGAGKSTLMRVAFGLVRPDGGALLVNGVERRFASSAQAIGAGLGMVHQHFSLVPAMTVAENVALGGRGRYGARRAAEVVRRVSADAGLALDPAALVGSLGVGAQQRVEIVKALSRDARVLILDEPTAVLAPAEAEELLRWLRRFVAGGRSAVIIAHKLREVLAVADDITVLRHGRTVLTAPRGEATEDTLADAMLGGRPPRERSLPNDGRGRAGGAEHGARPAVMRADGLTIADAAGVVRVRGATAAIGAGEIVGVVGIEGSGHRELLRALAGRLAPHGGTLELPDEVGFVPEDRHHDALLLDFSIAENVALRGAGTRRGRMRWPVWETITRRILSAFDVRTATPAAAARTLSGGNQQKLVLGRELLGTVGPEVAPRGGAGATAAAARGALPPAIVVENPTRGLDIRATAEVHQRIRDARDGGTAVVVYSSDLDEALLLADRMLVVHAGEVRELPVERDRVARALVGAT